MSLYAIIYLIVLGAITMWQGRTVYRIVSTGHAWRSEDVFSRSENPRAWLGALVFEATLLVLAIGFFVYVAIGQIL